MVKKPFKNDAEKKDFRKNRKEERKNMALGLKPTYTLKNQNLKAPSLNLHKKTMISDLNKKKHSSSRQELIDNLNRKLGKHNVSDFVNIETYKSEALSKEMLYDPSNDKNILHDEEKKLNENNKEMSRRAYMKVLQQVIENSDVIIQVLDARDPLSCRSKELESTILSHKDEKKIILVINKIDLIPIENALMWQKYLKREYPTILFKANTQNQNSNLSNASLFNKSINDMKEYVDEVVSSNKAIGGENLLNLLKNYCRVEGMKKTIVVGIVGFPNVGKSSLINSMKRGKVVGVSSTPGYTKGLQEIILDREIKLLDCPGVVFSHSDNTVENILHNVIRTEEIKDPIEVVSHILNKIPRESIMEVYKLDQVNWDSTEKVLYYIGEKLKKYKKGGLIDFDKTARLIINDWNEGKLKYFTLPPGFTMEQREMDIE